MRRRGQRNAGAVAAFFAALPFLVLAMLVILKGVLS